MFLSGAWLAKNAQGIFTPFNEQQIDCSAYTMRLGLEAYVSPEDAELKAPKLVQLAHQQAVEIHPGQFAFLLTREFITVPYDLFVLINIKNRLKVQGLVNVSGFHVDPGYKGHLVFAVFNAGPKSLIIREGDDIFLAWLSRIENPSSEYIYKKRGVLGIGSDLIASIPRESASLSSINRRVDALNTKLSYIIGALGIVSAIAIGTASTLLADLIWKAWKG